jgi:hypothetical protein
MTSFKSFPPNLVNNLGLLAFTTGNRPSAFFEWNEPEDWENRLAFDTLVMNTAMPNLIKQILGGAKHDE